MKDFIVFIVVLLMLGGCVGESAQAEYWGGNYTLALPKGQKLVTATWRGVNLWYLVRPMKDGEHPETLQFIEDAIGGKVTSNGKVTFVESR